MVDFHNLINRLCFLPVVSKIIRHLLITQSHSKNGVKPCPHLLHRGDIVAAVLLPFAGLGTATTRLGLECLRGLGRRGLGGLLRNRFPFPLPLAGGNLGSNSCHGEGRGCERANCHQAVWEWELGERGRSRDRELTGQAVPRLDRGGSSKEATEHGEKSLFVDGFSYNDAKEGEESYTAELMQA